jgi:hypothetical protein
VVANAKEDLQSCTSLGLLGCSAKSPKRCLPGPVQHAWLLCLEPAEVPTRTCSSSCCRSSSFSSLCVWTLGLQPCPRCLIRSASRHFRLQYLACMQVGQGMSWMSTFEQPSWSHLPSKLSDSQHMPGHRVVLFKASWLSVLTCPTYVQCSVWLLALQKSQDIQWKSVAHVQAQSTNSRLTHHLSRAAVKPVTILTWQTSWRLRICWPPGGKHAHACRT